MPQVESRRNGIIVNIPADARNVIGRFATKGDNELVFDQASVKGRKMDAEVSHIGSPAEQAGGSSAKAGTKTRGRKRSAQHVEDMV